MENMIVSPNFKVYVDFSASRRVAFQFSFAGTEQSGVSYVNRNIAEGADMMTEARIAAKIVAKRAGASEVELHAVQAPTR